MLAERTLRTGSSPLALRGLAALTVLASPALAASPRALPLATRRAAVLVAQPDLGPDAARAEVGRLDAAWAWSAAQPKGAASVAWKERLREGRWAVLSKAYLDTLPGHPGLTEAQLLEAYLGQGEQRRISHVLCKTREEAEAALHRLQAGASFDEVATEASTDPSAKVNHGELGWLRKQQLVAAFADPVFAAPVGDLVGPLKSEYGWHVAKTWEVRRPTPESFKDAAPLLRKQEAQAQLALKRDRALETLRRTYPLVPNMAVLGADRTTEVLPGDERKIAGRIGGTTISLAALKRYLVESLKSVGQSHTLGAGTKAQFMEGLADQFRLALAAQKRGLDRSSEVQGALWLQEREMAYARFTEEFLAKVPVPDATLQAHHEAFPDRFLKVGALRLQVLVAPSQEAADTALDQVRKGLSWREAVQRFGDAEATGNPEPGWVQVADLEKLVPPSLLKPLLEGTLNQAVGPMLGPDGFMLFRALERRPGPRLPFAECRDAVRADYLKDHGKALVDAALDLRAATPEKR